MTLFDVCLVSLPHTSIAFNFHVIMRELTNMCSDQYCCAYLEIICNERLLPDTW